MSSTLATIGKLVCAECNVNQQTSFIGNSTPDAIQILALINASGLELVAEYDWQALQTEYRLTTQYLTTTGNTTAGSPIITGIPSTAALAAGTWQGIVSTATGIQQDTYILTVNSSTSVTMSQNLTVTATGASITFGQTKYPFPSDFDRITNRTQWDKSKHWEMLGPENPQQWQWLKSGYISTGPRIRWRRMGNTLQIWPAVNTNEYLGFEYISNNWTTTASGAGNSTFQNDTDTCIFDDRLIILKSKLKYFEVKGWDTEAFKRDYDRLLIQRKAYDSGSPTLNMAPGASQVLVGMNNIPDSGFGI